MGAQLVVLADSTRDQCSCAEHGNVKNEAKQRTMKMFMFIVLYGETRFVMRAPCGWAFKWRESLVQMLFTIFFILNL